MGTSTAHLWAIAYDDPGQAEHTRAQVTLLAGAGQHLLLLDVAILTRAADGSYTLDREPFPLTSNVLAGGTVLKTNVDLERAKLIQTTLSSERVAVSQISNGDPK